MKVLIYVLIALTFALIVFNLTQLDFNNITQGNSLIALICALASACALCILLIFNTARSIDQKTGRR